MFAKDQIFTVRIDDMNNEGNGVCRVDGTVFFVIGAVTGDVCKVKVIKTAKNYCVAVIAELIEPSQNRVQPLCGYKRCGGCSFKNITPEHELQIKRRIVEGAFLRAGVEIPVAEVTSVGDGTRYRNKAQFPVGVDKNLRISFGYYAQHSHDIVFCEDCIIADPEFPRIARTVCDFADSRGITAYSEKTGKGLLRHVCMRSGTGGILLIIVINAKRLPFCDELISTVTSAHPRVCGITVNVNEENTNVIYGKKYVSIYGKETLRDDLCGRRFEISPASFYQVNHDCCEALYKKAAELLDLKGSEVVVDLYCGVGTVGLCAARGTGRLIGVEIVPEAVENARINARLNEANNAEFLCGDSSVIKNAVNGKVDAIIVDPPRKGLSDEVIDAIFDIAPDKLLYISCDPDTLARDLKKLLGSYTADTAYPFNMFPKTGHVECVTLMTRK